MATLTVALLATALSLPRLSAHQVREYLGSAAFSKAVQCVDLHSGELVCIKIIKNNKDFFDQVAVVSVAVVAFLLAAPQRDQP